MACFQNHGHLKLILIKLNSLKVESIISVKVPHSVYAWPHWGAANRHPSVFRGHKLKRLRTTALDSHSWPFSLTCSHLVSTLPCGQFVQQFNNVWEKHYYPTLFLKSSVGKGGCIICLSPLAGLTSSHIISMLCVSSLGFLRQLSCCSLAWNHSLLPCLGTGQQLGPGRMDGTSQHWIERWNSENTVCMCVCGGDGGGWD